jgi:hypothetical protein
LAEENQNCNFKEFNKKIRRIYGLAKDVIITDGNGLEYQEEENAFQYRKELWLSRKRSNKTAKNGEFFNFKVIVVKGEVSISYEAIIYSLWNKEAMISYINQLTGVKDKMCNIEINEIYWNNNLSIGSLKPKMIKITVTQDKFVRKDMNIIDDNALNIQTINVKYNGMIRSYTGPKNITLGQAFASWSLLGVEIPPFDYIQVNGRTLTEYEYKIEKIDHWPWNKVFMLITNVKGGYVIPEDLKISIENSLIRM